MGEDHMLSCRQVWTCACRFSSRLLITYFHSGRWMARCQRLLHTALHSRALNASVLVNCPGIRELLLPFPTHLGQKRWLICSTIILLSEWKKELLFFLKKNQNYSCHLTVLKINIKWHFIAVYHKWMPVAYNVKNNKAALATTIQLWLGRGMVVVVSFQTQFLSVF